jgi:hypothetical protein
MTDTSTELLSAVQELRDLVRLIAEPAIAERDKKYRIELRRIVGNSKLKVKAVQLMDGTRTQASICKESHINKGQLSIFVAQLKVSNLLSGDGKQPRLVISVPITFFEGGAD